MAYVTMVDGTPIYYREAGEGKPVVFLQGLMLTAEGFWTKNLDAIAENNRVIAFDHRSHGLSGKPLAGHSVEQCAEDLREVLEQLNLSDVTLVGVAFGAMVILEYLRRYGSQRLSALVIVEAQVRLLNAPDWEHPTFGDFSEDAAAGFVAACEESRGALSGFLDGAFGSPPSAEEMQRMQCEAWLTPTGAAIEYVRSMIAADYRSDLSHITLPVLLIYGRSNNVPIPSELGSWMHSQLADSRLELFEESGHSPFYEDPVRFNQSVTEFVQEVYR